MMRSAAFTRSRLTEEPGTVPEMWDFRPTLPDQRWADDITDIPRTEPARAVHPQRADHAPSDVTRCRQSSAAYIRCPREKPRGIVAYLTAVTYIRPCRPMTCLTPIDDGSDTVRQSLHFRHFQFGKYREGDDHPADTAKGQ